MTVNSISYGFWAATVNQELRCESHMPLLKSQGPMSYIVLDAKSQICEIPVSS